MSSPPTEQWVPSEWQQSVLDYLNTELVPSWFNSPRRREGLTTVLLMWIQEQLRQRPDQFILLDDYGESVYHLQREARTHNFPLAERFDNTHWLFWFGVGRRSNPDITITVRHIREPDDSNDANVLEPGVCIVYAQKHTAVAEARAVYARELDPHLPPDLARIIVDEYLSQPASPLVSWLRFLFEDEGRIVSERKTIRA